MIFSRRLFYWSATVTDPLIITNSCAKKVKTLSEKALLQTGKPSFLRLSIDAGGCGKLWLCFVVCFQKTSFFVSLGGFQYCFELDSEKQEDDIRFEKDGAVVVTDETSMEYLHGAVIDYKEEMVRSGFSIVENPIASSNCGCGVSFSPKT